jgi:Tol biopolymer transport system component
VVQSGDLWIQDLTRGTFTHLTTAEAVADALPVWTPDSRIVFRSATGLRVMSENASRSSEAFEGTTLLDYPASVTPDGGRLVFIRQSSKTSADIYVASLRGDSKITAVLNTPSYEGGPRLSPDGRWIAYSSNESGRMEVFLSPFPRVDRKAQVSVEGGTQATWNPNGREIFYRNGTKMMSVAVSTAPTLSLGAPRLVFDHRYAFGAPLTIPNYDVSPDGERFVMIKDESSSGRLNVVLNWTEELKQRVPTR